MFDFLSFSEYLRYERNYSSHTILSYQNDLRQFTQYLVTHLDIKDLSLVSHVHIRSWIVHLMKQEYAPKTINRKLSTLKSYYKYQLKLGVLTINPASKISGPKLSQRLPHVIRENDIDKMITLLEEDNSFESLRDLLVINLLYQTGIRRDELINLKETDVNFARQTIKVLGKGNKERLLPISQKLAVMIQDYQKLKETKYKDACSFLVVTNKGVKMYPKFVYNTVHTWISKVSTDSKRSPHILRHSFATHLADNGAELNAIKELLGHASLAATAIYTHNSIERLKDVYGKAHPRAEKKR